MNLIWLRKFAGANAGMVKYSRAILCSAILAIFCSISVAQGLPSAGMGAAAAQRKQPGSRAVGYTEIGASEYLSMIPPYPALQTPGDDVDVAEVRQWQKTGDERWQLAQADAQVSYERFAEVYGSAINTTATPLLVNLLDRVFANLSAAMGGAKSYYNRPRPYQRFQMNRVCGFDAAPVPEASPKSGNSYPSGHATFGWSVALILAEVAPEHAQAILARGREYSESRMVCGVHFPSDVHAGEILVSRVIGRIQDLPEFRRELGCARQERAVALKTGGNLEGECLTLKNELDRKAAAVSK
jgi:acid phosphatase (class A)